MDILIHFDEVKFNSSKEFYNNHLQALQNTIDSFNTMGFAPLTADEYSRLFKEKDELLFDKMTNGVEVSIAGLKVHKHKAIEILQKPHGYNEFMSTYESTIQLLASGNHLGNRVDALLVTMQFELNEAGKVVLKQSFIDQLEKSFKKFATSEKAKKMYQLANGIIDKCKELNAMQLIANDPNGLIGILREIIEGGDRKPLAIKVQGIINLNNE